MPMRVSFSMSVCVCMCVSECVCVSVGVCVCVCVSSYECKFMSIRMPLYIAYMYVHSLKKNQQQILACRNKKIVCTKDKRF